MAAGAGTAFAQTQEEKLQDVNARWELTEEGKVVFCEQFEFPDMTRDELFNHSVAYVREAVGEGSAVSADKENGLIRCSAVFPQVYPDRKGIDPAKCVSVEYDLVVEVRDSKARIRVILNRYDLPLAIAAQESDRPIDWYPVNVLGKKKVYGLDLLYNTSRESENLFAAYPRHIRGLLSQK